MNKKIIIVGGVAGGASAAARLRRLDEHCEIILFERGNDISFANCGLPYYIGSSIKERENLLVSTPKDMQDKFNIDVRTKSDVIHIDFNKKEVTVKNSKKGTYIENYDSLILSPGAKPIKPQISGINNEKIFTLRNMDDTDKIKEFITKNAVNSAAIIGGGFIGIEMAENLNNLNIDITLIEAAPHILPPFDSDMVTIAEKELQDNNINLILNNGVKSFSAQGDKIETILNNNETLTCDMVILAIGVTPDVGFLKDTTLELGPKGHIIVDKHLKTNIDNVYAVGDAIEIVDFVNGKKSAVPLAGPANKQGRIAADNICNIKTSYTGTQGSSILKVCELTCACTGNNEKTLTKNNTPYNIIYVYPQSHASYYPGATPLSLKLIFNDDGKILGAQGIGYEGVDKRIDTIATVIRLNGNVTNLTELELCYAPPYSSAKDPVNIAGYYAEDVLTKKSRVVLPRDVDTRDKDSVILLDVRTSLEQETGSIEGSTNIPLQVLRKRLNEINKDKEIWTYCQIGLRGYLAERVLKENGFNVKNITGGFKQYMNEKFKVTNVKKKEIDSTPKTFKVDSSTIKNLDACGLSCPGPLMRVKSEVDKLHEGDILCVSASDPGFFNDIKSWCKKTKVELLNLNKEKGIIKATLKKTHNNPCLNTVTTHNESISDSQTMVVFSGDLDKAIASFIIANGAASMGKKVTMFFTFWGINIIRKNEHVPLKKNFIENMFSKMMPRGSSKLKLSNMNMGGLGSRMIKGIMKKHNVTSLEELIQSAIDSGVELVACQMSMDLLGLKREELIDGIKLGGVGYYLGEADNSNINLFI